MSKYSGVVVEADRGYGHESVAAFVPGNGRSDPSDTTRTLHLRVPHWSPKAVADTVAKALAEQTGTEEEQGAKLLRDTEADIIRRFREQYVDFTPEDFEAFILEALERYGKVVLETNVKEPSTNYIKRDPPDTRDLNSNNIAKLLEENNYLLRTLISATMEKTGEAVDTRLRHKTG